MYQFLKVEVSTCKSSKVIATLVMLRSEPQTENDLSEDDLSDKLVDDRLRMAELVVFPFTAPSQADLVTCHLKKENV
jgi:hypothetical protein